MRYTDTFCVATRFCMVQRDAEHSSLRISAEPQYIKNVNSFARGNKIFEMFLLNFFLV